MRQVKSQTVRTCCLISVLLLPLLSACASQSNWSWQHPEGYDARVRQQEIAACELLAIRETNRNDYYIPYDYYYPYYFDRHYRHDRHHYYSHFFHFNAHRELQDRRRFFRICMESKGWRKVKIDGQPQPANQ